MTLISLYFTSVLHYFIIFALFKTIFYFSNASSFQIAVVKYGESPFGNEQ